MIGNIKIKIVEIIHEKMQNQEESLTSSMMKIKPTSEKRNIISSNENHEANIVLRLQEKIL